MKRNKDFYLNISYIYYALGFFLFGQIINEVFHLSRIENYLIIISMVVMALIWRYFKMKKSK